MLHNISAAVSSGLLQGSLFYVCMKMIRPRKSFFKVWLLVKQSVQEIWRCNLNKEAAHIICHVDLLSMLYFDLRPGPKMLFQGDAPERSDTWPVIERDRVGGLRLIIWDKVKVPRYHYSDAPEESNLWTAWQLFPLDDD